MCGIACYLGRDKEEGLKFGVRSVALLKHRGPDDDGIYNDEHITLSHTRLSILELSELGHQPMPSSCGRYVIVYNGEIYNHLELRKKYLSGHHFRGHSDTETIIELFRVKKEKTRPVHGRPWEYVFYVDCLIESEAEGARAVEALKRHCSMVKELGRYREAGSVWANA